MEVVFCICHNIRIWN